jgi:hypothetical protein
MAPTVGMVKMVRMVLPEEMVETGEMACEVMRGEPGEMEGTEGTDATAGKDRRDLPVLQVYAMDLIAIMALSETGIGTAYLTFQSQKSKTTIIKDTDIALEGRIRITVRTKLKFLSMNTHPTQNTNIPRGQTGRVLEVIDNTLQDRRIEANIPRILRIASGQSAVAVRD